MVKNEDDLMTEFLQSFQMDQVADYLRRGRRFESLSIPNLEELWTGAFREYAQRILTSFKVGKVFRQPERLDVDDSEAELRLRGVEPPTQAVKRETAALRKLFSSIDPDALAEPQPNGKLERFLAEWQKPKN